jgi:glucose-6-phosphate isomerase
MDLATGVIEGRPIIRRRLSDLRDAFADPTTCEVILRMDDPLIYTLSTFDEAEGPGQLHCGLAVLYPGKVGDEYYLTRGHMHARRESAELYIGLRGTGMLLMEQEDGTESRVVELVRNSFVYVPGHTAHRTINTGNEPLVYLGIYPADAGHDYSRIRARNFSSVVCCDDGEPVVVSRESFLDSLDTQRES